MAFTVTLFYSFCTLAWVLFRTEFLTFMNNLFHGLDFTNLLTAQPFSIQGFVYVLFVIGLWGVLIGSFYSWLRCRLLK